MGRRWARGLALSTMATGAIAAIVACGDDDAGAVNAGPAGDAGADGRATPDAGAEASLTDAQALVDAGADADDAETGAPATPIILPLPDTGHARLYSVTYGPDGSIFAVGQASNAGTSDLALLLVKLTPSGVLDTTFNGTGYVIQNVSTGLSGEIFRGVVVQTEGANAGKIVVAGAAEHDLTDAAATTRDIVVARFRTNGTLDDDFGTGGVARFPLGDGAAVQQYGLAKYANDDVIVTGARAPDLSDFDGGPADAAPPANELAVLRLKAEDGTFASFGPKSDGVFSLRLAQRLSPRLATVLDDDSAVVAAYTNPGSGNRPIIAKLTPAGVLDTTFGTGGVFYPETGVEGFGNGQIVETYDVALQGDRLVTTGYGKESSTQPAEGWISLRLGSTGTLDPTYGQSGHQFVGVNDQNAASRALVVLPDRRVVLLGGASPPKPAGDVASQPQHAAIAILTESGQLDPTWSATGPRLFDLGGPAKSRAAHFFWGGAVSPDRHKLVVVGVKGGVVANDAGLEVGPDQAVIMLLDTGS